MRKYNKSSMNGFKNKSMTVKEKLAEYFLTDAKEFLLKYDFINKSEYPVSVSCNSKKLVDLLFAIECALKSYIIHNYNDANLKNKYKKIKTHNISDLLEKIPCNEFSDFREFYKNKLHEFSSVSLRYSIEAQLEFRDNDYGALSEKYYVSLGDADFLDQVYQIASQLINDVDYRNPVDLDNATIKFKEIDLEEIKRVSTELKDLSKK